ncbi:MAG: hypothetical protein ABR549_07395 [Mycobacteriales bacterium]
MSLRSLLTQTATVRSAASGTAADAEGNWTPGALATATYPALLQQTETIETFEGRDRLTSTHLLFLEATAVISGRDLVDIGGRHYEVVGQPAVLRTPRGAHHIEARLRDLDN